MNKEIERKFLVEKKIIKNDENILSEEKIIQGYIFSSTNKEVRVRIKNKKGFITVKSGLMEDNISRKEWEKEISLFEAQNLLEFCDSNIIEKKRYSIKFENHIFEVDEFYGNNLGLIIAEVELGSANEKFLKPIWLGREVTGDLKYYNSNLQDKPYSKWV